MHRKISADAAFRHITETSDKRAVFTAAAAARYLTNPTQNFLNRPHTAPATN
jgi:hypothetical protein